VAIAAAAASAMNTQARTLYGVTHPEAGHWWEPSSRRC
jgi:hypothetical protein